MSKRKTRYVYVMRFEETTELLVYATLTGLLEYLGEYFVNIDLQPSVMDGEMAAAEGALEAGETITMYGLIMSRAELEE